MKELHLWIVGFFVMKRIDYKEGQLVGDYGIVFLHDEPPQISPKGNKRRMGLFRCKCGNEFITNIASVSFNASKSCGCSQKKAWSKVITKHGLSKHPLYKTWKGINKRCYNKNAKTYKDYGGRGIAVCDEWRNDFKAFFDYVVSLPNYDEDNLYRKGLSLDRIDNDGNYEHSNVRWANNHTQRANVRKRKDNTSGYTGVFHVKPYNRWYSYIRVNKKAINLGNHGSPEDALKARNQYIIDNELWEYPIQNCV